MKIFLIALATLILAITCSPFALGVSASVVSGEDAVVWDEWQNEPSAYSADRYGKDNFRLYEFRVGQSPVDKNGYQTHGIEFRQTPLLKGKMGFWGQISREDLTEADVSETIGGGGSGIIGQMLVGTEYPPSIIGSTHQSMKAIAQVKPGQSQSWEFKSVDNGSHVDQVVIGTIKFGRKLFVALVFVG